MDERAKWKRLEAISQEKRKSDEESRKGKWLIRKAAGQDAESAQGLQGHGGNHLDIGIVLDEEDPLKGRPFHNRLTEVWRTKITVHITERVVLR